MHSSEKQSPGKDATCASSDSSAFDVSTGVAHTETNNNDDNNTADAQNKDNCSVRLLTHSVFTSPPVPIAMSADGDAACVQQSLTNVRTSGDSDVATTPGSDLDDSAVIAYPCDTSPLIYIAVAAASVARRL